MPNTSLRRPQKGFRRGGKQAYHGGRPQRVFAASTRAEGTSAEEKWERVKMARMIDDSMGFVRYTSGKRREGWLVNVQPASVEDEKNTGGRAALDCYFIQPDNSTFKATIEYDPYFFVAVKKGRESEVEEWIKRVPGDGVVKSIRRIEKDDLSLPNHLLGHRRALLELRFTNVRDLMAVRNDILPVAEKNKKNMNAVEAYAQVVASNENGDLFDDDFNDDERKTNNALADASDYIVDIREYDVPYHVRVMIDMDIRVGKWYFVEAKHGVTSMWPNPDKSLPADPVVLAFDIETTKLPLKFPDSAIDQVMMISYMIDGQGFLITNREIISEDIGDFDYTPKPEYPGPFMIFNEPNEKALLERFLLHVKEARPTVIATYNGDFFDWPFVEARASFHGIDLYQETGWYKGNDDQYRCNYSVHMDCFHWVNRDSYLPQGSRGLKAVTVAKLGYDPDELDPELMLPYAAERPQTLAEYSVSDAVATYYLYIKYIHPFIFSLCTILPLGPDDTLRKGTGTLCEMLLMVQAYKKEIVLPNKHQSPREAFWDGHLLDSETYVGGHVESIEAGVFRADIAVDFAVDAGAVDELLGDLDAALEFVITVEEKKALDEVENLDEVKQQIVERLTKLKETPNRHERPLIYHLDVASMYPNIMTTNRLQPDSMVTEADCAACDFNRPGKTCDRRLPWAWRGEYMPAKRGEYNMIRNALENEKFPGKQANGPMRRFQDLTLDEQAALVRKRLQMFSQKVYHRIHESTTITREAIICQRENPFYINTVRDFRDRRYDYKGQAKVWKGKADALKRAGAAAGDIEAANKMVVVYDSLQLAHKVILNSFYGYVMRKASRWHSMEMAGVTCLTGATIIQMARQLVERLGRPLELDTDGIWCMLPATFPENFCFRLRNGKTLNISYPCVMLNHLVHHRFTNHQYQTLVDAKTLRYETHSDNSIFFEVDGPYRAMVLPTSKEEDKNLKKRYAVFNHDGSLAELKGFELKRRGELKLIKIFQQQVFGFFLEGSSLAECYSAVAKVANRWLDVLYNRGSTLADEELMDLICENRSMSKTLREYGAQKSTSITTARRLADFLGEQMVKDKGLNCKFIICSKPRNAPVTERAVPVAIFSAEETTKRAFLRKWLKEDTPNTDPRALLDWNYYLERLGSVIQKLITIPAALQKLRNPVPRVKHPDWLQKRINTKDDRMKQKKLTDMGAVVAADKRAEDMEDFGTQLLRPKAIGELLAASSSLSSSQLAGQKRKLAEQADKADGGATELPETMPNPSDDYAAFLQYQKKKWKMQKQARIRRRQLFGQNKTRAGGNSNIEQTFQKQAHATFLSTWQLVHLKAGDMPGVVTTHALMQGRMQSVKMKVPRQVFVNVKSDCELPKVDIAGCEVEHVNYTLPNGQEARRLFRLTVAEEVYVREAAKFGRLFNHASVEGVYETQVPLNMRAVLRLGNVCALDEQQEGVLGRGLESGFELGGLKRPAQCQAGAYLEAGGLAYVYVTHIAAGERHVFGVFASTGSRAHVVVVQRSDAGVHDMPSLAQLYRDMLARRAAEAGETNWQESFEYPAELAFKVSRVTTLRRAHLELGDVVRGMVREAAGRPVVAVVQSPQRETLVQQVPGLGDGPVLALRYDAADGALPSLAWQGVVARRLVGHFLGLGTWVAHLTQLARHGDVPLCNLEGDDARFLIDVAYARRLQASGVVLWWAAGARPDDGGHERDAVLAGLDTPPAARTTHAGTYAAVCIDVDVRNLAVNTMLTSALVHDLEGADADALPSDGAFSSAGMAVLRDMVKAWWAEACRGSSVADVLVQHLVRWVESPQSLLYHGALVRYVHMVARKALQQLMGHVRRLGCQVVFGCATRLVLQTTKRDVETALNFARFVLASVKSEPLFHFLDLEVREYWDYLVWYDDYNYGGKACRALTANNGVSEHGASPHTTRNHGTPDNNTPDDDAATTPLETIMHWQMATLLPERLQPVFHDWVVEFIHLMHRFKHHAISASPSSLTQAPSSSSPADLAFTKTYARPLKKAMAGLIAQQKREMLHPELAHDYSFPALPGAHLPSTRPPLLELVKALAQVVCLDKTVGLDARILRRDLLHLLDVREFSAAAAFVNPSCSLVVQTSCAACTATRALDLCRDDDLVFGGGGWVACAVCGARGDRDEVEARLVALAQASVVLWAAQDVQCARCGALRVSDLIEHCTCSGEWKACLVREDVVRRMGVMRRVAGYYKMSMLQQVVDGIYAAL